MFRPFLSAPPREAPIQQNANKPKMRFLGFRKMRTRIVQTGIGALLKETTFAALLIVLATGVFPWHWIQTAEMEDVEIHTAAHLKPGQLVPVEVSTTSVRYRGPPAYLPLAQHLKNINISKDKPSLRDMVYGTQKRSLPDLRGTDNSDMASCVRCRLGSVQVSSEDIKTANERRLAETVISLVRFYNIMSMAMVPCTPDGVWMLAAVRAIRELEPNFSFYCGVKKNFDLEQFNNVPKSLTMNGWHFMVYHPLVPGSLPAVDLMFTWEGLESLGFDEIHNFFKETVESKVNYTLIGNTPGYANAKLVETSCGTFSIMRPVELSLNVRGFPFGFNGARRVIPVFGKQLLLYNSSEMRDVW